MFNWFKPKETESNVTATLRKRITDVELRLDDLEAFQENIRNQARKIQRNRRSDEAQEETETNNKPQVLIPV
jgi:hypothetical protein